ncbi:MAG: phosphatidylserine decarboxylase family protein [Pseudomonadota bacterium]
MICRAGHYEPIAREGLVFILPLAVIAFVCWGYGRPWTSLFFILASAAVALFFRNPERTPPEGDHLVLSPADGRTVEIVDNASSRHLDGYPLKRISIFMSIFNTHVNRWPVDGIVRKIDHCPGRFLDAREPDASIVNEHNSLVVRGAGFNLEVVQIAGKVARRIAWWVSEGEPVQRGRRFGLIRFGSRLDVYIPSNFTVEVSVGDKVRAGETVIAKIPPGEVTH